jgi:hypothetical protein
MRTMNTPLHPLLLEIARLANVTPQEAIERIAGSVLEQIKVDPELFAGVITEVIAGQNSAESHALRPQGNLSA